MQTTSCALLQHLAFRLAESCMHVEPIQSQACMTLHVAAVHHFAFVCAERNLNPRMACLKRREEEKVLQLNQPGAIAMGNSYVQQNNVNSAGKGLSLGMSGSACTGQGNYADLGGALDVYGYANTGLQPGATSQSSVSALDSAWPPASNNSLSGPNEHSNSSNNSKVSVSFCCCFLHTVYYYCCTFSTVAFVFSASKHSCEMNE